MDQKLSTEGVSHKSIDAFDDFGHDVIKLLVGGQNREIDVDGSWRIMVDG